MSGEKLNESHTLSEAMCVMADCNPGALSVLIRLMHESDAIDPDAIFKKGFFYIGILDALNIYGSKIWMLYKDVCKENLVDFLGVLRAYQLGFLSEAMLKKAIDEPSSLDVEKHVAQVRGRLSNFDAIDRGK